MRKKVFLEKFANLIENENFLRVLISIGFLVPLILIFDELKRKIFYTIFQIFKEKSGEIKDYYRII